MFLLFNRYINRVFLALSVIVSLAACVVLNFEAYETYRSYQHPFLTMLVVGFYVLMITKLDFTNGIYIMRFSSRAQCMLKTMASLCLFALEYYSVLLALFILICLGMGGAVSAASVLFCYVFTLLSLFVLNVFYVILSFKFSGLLTKIFLYSILFLGYAMNFSGEIFIRYNFFFFNMYTSLDQGVLIGTLVTYCSLIFVGTIFLQVRDKEL